MPQILTNVTSALEHYLSYKNLAGDFPRITTLSITGATTLSAEGTLAFGDASALYGAGKRLYAVVSSITDIATDMTLTLKDGASTSGTATVKAHAGIDVMFPITNASNPDLTAPTGAITVTVSGGTAGVKIEIISIDESVAWLNLGENFNEGLSFQDGVMTAPVARGYNATDHSKRIRVNNSWSVRQLYSSCMEGIANLRGKEVMLKVETRTDGATVKEIHYVVRCQVQNAAQEIGGGGGEAQADALSAGGSYKRRYVVCLDAVALTA